MTHFEGDACPVREGGSWGGGGGEGETEAATMEFLIKRQHNCICVIY